MPVAVISGTFRQAQDQLQADFADLVAAGCTVASPKSLDWVAERNGFVVAAHEQHEPTSAIEGRHLRALERGDFVWLHAPEGYLGPSGAMELGFAHALGLPIFCREAPNDQVFRSLVTQVSSPGAAVEAIGGDRGDAPTRSLASLQAYYRKTASLRGYDSESPAECLLMLTEELGELARAVRQGSDVVRESGNAGNPIGEELADMQLYLVHLANTLELDLADAVQAKERINADRALARLQREAA